MQTPYLVVKGAEEARKVLNEAVGIQGEIQAIALADNSTRTNTLKEPLKELYDRLHKVHEWLHAIEESRG